MKTLFALLLIAPLISFAKSASTTSENAETKIPVKEGYGTLDMSDFKKLDQPVNGGKSGVNFATTCKSKTGVEYKQTDSGYEACLREAQLDKTIGTTNGATPSMGVQFGN